MSLESLRGPSGWPLSDPTCPDDLNNQCPHFLEFPFLKESSIQSVCKIHVSYKLYTKNIENNLILTSFYGHNQAIIIFLVYFLSGFFFKCVFYFHSWLHILLSIQFFKACFTH